MRRLLLSIVVPGLVAGACSATGPTDADDYVPDVPLAYDEHYLSGSFEDAQGFGWDTCASRTFGAGRHVPTGGSEGSAYFRFDWDEVCTDCKTDATRPSAAMVYLWFSTEVSATEDMGLYFDAVNEASAEPTGVLRFYGTDELCVGEDVLAEIDLSRLQLSSSWATRCAMVSGPGAYRAIGLADSGGMHQIGVDALRLGPPCHR